jgi:hypothetical protein
MGGFSDQADGNLERNQRSFPMYRPSEEGVSQSTLFVGCLKWTNS